MKSRSTVSRVEGWGERLATKQYLEEVLQVAEPCFVNCTLVKT